VAGVSIALLFPTPTVVRRHLECSPDPCYEVVGPVAVRHRALRMLIGLVSTAPAATLLLLFVARQRGYRRLHLAAGLILVTSILLAVVLPSLLGSEGCFGQGICGTSTATNPVRLGLAAAGFLVSLVLYLLGAAQESRARASSAASSWRPAA